MDENEIGAFNMAVELYTDLLFNQKELITKIIETAYARGIQEGINYAQQQMIVAAQQQQVSQEQEPENPFENEEYYPQQMQVREPVAQPQTPPPRVEKPEQPKPKTPAEELISRMKGVKR